MEIPLVYIIFDPTFLEKNLMYKNIGKALNRLITLPYSYKKHLHNFVDSESIWQWTQFKDIDGSGSSTLMKEITQMHLYVIRPPS